MVGGIVVTLWSCGYVVCTLIDMWCVEGGDAYEVVLSCSRILMKFSQVGG